jgi:methionyl aminopeptidase
MYTRVKTAKEIKALRESCRMAATILDTVFAAVEPGMTGIDINEMVKRELKGMGLKAAFYGYQGFPAAICISRNDEVVHGIPNSQELEAGDLLSLDFGVDYKGMISDTARTVIVGEGGDMAAKKKLIAGTQESLMAAIKVVKDGVQTGDIGAAAQEVMDRYGLGIVRDLVGHGVGHDVHEEPNIPNHGTRGMGDRLKAGMTIAIEPMATLGSHRVVVNPDGWTIRTVDGSLSAHFEHTILITDTGAEILTQS